MKRLTEDDWEKLSRMGFLECLPYEEHAFAKTFLFAARVEEEAKRRLPVIFIGANEFIYIHIRVACTEQRIITGMKNMNAQVYRALHKVVVEMGKRLAYFERCAYPARYRDETGQDGYERIEKEVEKIALKAIRGTPFYPAEDW